jgi:hypothetical protein
VRKAVQTGLAILALASGAFAQDRIAEMRSRFAQETDPVRRAKILPDLGTAEFDQIQKETSQDDFSDAVVVLDSYRDQAQGCLKALDSRGVDAEKHPSGFKQLQISVQESLRRLDTLLPEMTGDDQKPFLAVRKELDDMNRHLIDELFPRRARPPKS